MSEDFYWLTFDITIACTFIGEMSEINPGHFHSTWCCVDALHKVPCRPVLTVHVLPCCMVYTLHVVPSCSVLTVQLVPCFKMLTVHVVPCCSVLTVHVVPFCHTIHSAYGVAGNRQEQPNDVIPVHVRELHVGRQRRSVQPEPTLPHFLHFQFDVRGHAVKLRLVRNLDITTNVPFTFAGEKGDKLYLPERQVWNGFIWY